MNSTKLIFSIVKNLKDIFENDKNVPIMKQISEKYFNNIINNPKCKGFLGVYKEIYNDIENNFYTHKNLIIAICYMYIFDTKLKIPQLYRTNIVNIVKLFTKEQLIKDRDFLLDVENKVKLGNISKYFDINENGESIIYRLIKDKNISPKIFIYFSDRILTSLNENIIFSDEYKRFEKIIKTIKDTQTTKE